MLRSTIRTKAPHLAVKIVLVIAFFAFFILLSTALFGHGLIQILASGIMSILMGAGGVWYAIMAVRLGNIDTIRTVHFRTEAPFSFWLNCTIMFLGGLFFLALGPVLLMPLLH